MSNWTNNDELRYYSWVDYDTETHVILPLQDKVNLYQISPSFFFYWVDKIQIVLLALYVTDVLGSAEPDLVVTWNLKNLTLHIDISIV